MLASVPSEQRVVMRQTSLQPVLLLHAQRSSQVTPCHVLPYAPGFALCPSTHVLELRIFRDTRNIRQYFLLVQ